MQKGQAQAKLAIADQDTPSVHIYDARGGSSEPLDTIQPHREPVQAMRFNSRRDTVISVDTKGRHLWCNEAFCPGPEVVSYIRSLSSFSVVPVLCMLGKPSEPRIGCASQSAVTTCPSGHISSILSLCCSKDGLLPYTMPVHIASLYCFSDSPGSCRAIALSTTCHTIDPVLSLDQDNTAR